MKHFPILQGRAYVVELPEGHQQAFEALKNGRELTINRKRKSANVDHITFDFDFAEQLFIGGFLACTSGNLDAGDRHYLFGLGWQIVGMLSEVTEEKVAELVEYDDINAYHPDFVNRLPWMNYKTGLFEYYIKFTAIQSLESAILAEGYTFKNKYGDVRPRIDDYSSVFQYRNDAIDYDDEKERVLSRDRCLLLRRMDG